MQKNLVAKRDPIVFGAIFSPLTSQKKIELLCSYDPDFKSLFQREVAECEGAEWIRELDEQTALCCWPEGFQPIFCRHRFPVQMIHTFEGSELDEVGGWSPGPEFVERVTGRFSFQVAANLRLPWSFGALIPRWLESFGLPGEGMDKRRPETVVSAYFHQTSKGLTLYLGVSAPEQNLSPWMRGECRIPRSKESVSRAEQKLLEALELCPGVEGSRALDLGAAPGGWTRILADRGFEVDAVDPAELDSRVVVLPKIHHHKTTAGVFLEQLTDSTYDLIVCDMKMEPLMACRLVLEFAPLLNDSGWLILTLKLPKGPSALNVARESLKGLSSSFQIVQARQLYFNRNEVTVIARK